MSIVEANSAKQCPIDFDHESAEHAVSWPDIYKRLRNACPVAFSGAHGGFWLPNKYQDVLRIAQDSDTFTSGKTFNPATGEVRGGAQIPTVPMPRMVPVETDPPEWNKFRAVLNPLFTPRAAQSRKQSAQRYATALLDRVIEQGHCDIAQEFNRPTPALLTMEIFGLPLHEWRTFSGHIHTLFSLSKTTPQYTQKVGEATAWILRRLAEEVQDRHANPKDDIISYLVSARIDGEPIDDETIRIICFNVIIGGVDTVNALTSNVLVYLWQNQRERRMLTEKPELIPAAMDEFVRYFTPAHALARTASRDIEISGQLIEKGDRVLLAYSAANRDPEVFDRPDEMILTRSPNRHVGFGAGRHHCLGSHQARVIFPVMLTEVLSRIPDYEVNIDEARRVESVASVNGWINIPIRFTPGTRVGDASFVL
jgi:cytochrome P450